MLLAARARFKWIEEEYRSPVFKLRDLMRGWLYWCIERWRCSHEEFKDSIPLQVSVSTPESSRTTFLAQGISCAHLILFFFYFTAATCTYEGTHTCLLENGVPCGALSGSLSLDTRKPGVFKITASQSANGPHSGARGTYEIIWKSLWIRCHLPTWLWMKSKS